jgi:alpha-D-ribose 1-methylphosphonate 5-triphosphate synthase subunit PhnI
MYVAVKGGEAAIAAAHRELDRARRGDPIVPRVTLDQIDQQLALAVDRVMAEGGLYDRDLAARALRQARGDQVEAAFLVRAYRTTLARFHPTLPIDTGRMVPRRRISAIFKDLPGGQLLGPTFDYTHRLIDFTDEDPPLPANEASADAAGPAPRIMDMLVAEGLLEPVPPDTGAEPGDITREPPVFPLDRATRLQMLARGDEGWLLGLGYATQRGYGNVHPFAGEIRMGEVEVVIAPPELDFPVSIGDVTVTECEMIAAFADDGERAPRFTRGYGLAFGESERKAIAMALVDRALTGAEEAGGASAEPTADQEFVLSHADNVEASGFVQHLKLPHYVDFQAELAMVRRLLASHRARAGSADGDAP